VAFFVNFNPILEQFENEKINPLTTDHSSS